MCLIQHIFSVPGTRTLPHLPLQLWHIVQKHAVVHGALVGPAFRLVPAAASMTRQPSLARLDCRPRAHMPCHLTPSGGEMAAKTLPPWSSTPRVTPPGMCLGCPTPSPKHPQVQSRAWLTEYRWSNDDATHCPRSWSLLQALHLCPGCATNEHAGGALGKCVARCSAVLAPERSGRHACRPDSGSG